MKHMKKKLPIQVFYISTCGLAFFYTANRKNLCQLADRKMANKISGFSTFKKTSGARLWLKGRSDSSEMCL
jgi:hypothetical protein